MIKGKGDFVDFVTIQVSFSEGIFLSAFCISLSLFFLISNYECTRIATASSDGDGPNVPSCGRSSISCNSPYLRRSGSRPRRHKRSSSYIISKNPPGRRGWGVLLFWFRVPAASPRYPSLNYPSFPFAAPAVEVKEVSETGSQ